ncbi:MAG: hypothetical protein CSA18_03690 [Deltaproteobacteria bacterium]|nr:MAG: hypothetical protein CSA18_03690 [Deltaproteobacteria bacterium]
MPYKPRNKTLFEIQKNILKRCPGCGVKEGGFHHVGCTMEVCPRCKHLWVSCRCSGIKAVDKKDAEIIPLFSFVL